MASSSACVDWSSETDSYVPYVVRDLGGDVACAVPIVCSADMCSNWTAVSCCPDVFALSELCCTDVAAVGPDCVTVKVSFESAERVVLVVAELWLFRGLGEWGLGEVLVC